MCWWPPCAWWALTRDAVVLFALRVLADGGEICAPYVVGEASLGLLPGSVEKHVLLQSYVVFFFFLNRWVFFVLLLATSFPNNWQTRQPAWQLQSAKSPPPRDKTKGPCFGPRRAMGACFCGIIFCFRVLVVVVLISMMLFYSVGVYRSTGRWHRWRQCPWCTAWCRGCRGMCCCPRLRLFLSGKRCVVRQREGGREGERERERERERDAHREPICTSRS